jgi:hypothetical protein
MGNAREGGARRLTDYRLGSRARALRTDLICFAHFLATGEA